MKQGLHVASEGFVVTVDLGPGCWWASSAGRADSSEERRDDLLAEGQQRHHAAGRLGRDLVAAGPAGLDDEALAAELPKVVGGLPGAVTAVVLAGQGLNLVGELRDGEASGAMASARAACSAERVRGLLTSTPPTRVAPI